MPEPEATAPRPQTSQETVETGILDRLTDEHQQRPLAVDEIVRDYDSRITTEDALRSLQADGLIHRCGQFVFATRAAIRGLQLRW
jgi:hypothetical protein